ncbi:hypothetical protein CFC21_046071 [Triticum aestivum]|uniref:RING-type E3 ubiquitin transferase n=2 Tax=Triticum aestivum TaxID=4565 RepID=A0A9R1JZA8_WHEAT|nr:U-box domain-containing protein 12-like [Triticum aestivum]KAF7035156.1 hypothetical protein CFC21_046071 [Triticum aestivum]
MANSNDLWEKKLQDPSATPVPLPFEFLKAITCDFSSGQELGRGEHGVVYKGVLPSGKFIAVKKLFQTHLMDDKRFQNELSSLMGIKHQNVVQLIGYCAETSFEMVNLQGSGKHIMDEIPKRLLCFEYVGNKSLHYYISDGTFDLEWDMRYEIIRGIYDGLHYLHEECHTVHLNLKPGNILMDATMVPKIANFGLSRIFGDKQSRIITENRPGTLGYMAPEYSFQGIVSMKADIFSLGIIMIEIVTGLGDYPLTAIPYMEHFNQDGSFQSTDTSFEHYYKEKIRLSTQALANIYHTWRNRLEKSQGATEKLEQIRACVELGLECTEINPYKRPATQHIMDRLEKVNITDEYHKAGESISAVAQAGESSTSNALHRGDTGTIVEIEKASILPAKVKEFVQVQVSAVSIPASENDIPIPKEDKSTSLVVPDAFRCARSLGLMKDPVMVATGQTYDRGSIVRWLDAGHDTCPRTKQKLANKFLTPNYALYGLIVQWCRANGLEQPKRSAQVSSDDGDATPASLAYSEQDVVAGLVRRLSSQNVVDQREAAGMLRLLAKGNSKYQACIGDSGGIPILVNLLWMDDISTQEHVVTALLDFSVSNYENKEKLVSAGAIPGVVYVLEKGSMVARENAAAMLSSLSTGKESMLIIGAAGSIPPLILLLTTGSQQGKTNAAETLMDLFVEADNKSIAIRAGFVPVLLELLTGTEDGIDSIFMLAIFSKHPEGKAAIAAAAAANAAAIPMLVGVIRNGSQGKSETEWALTILARICGGQGKQQKQCLAEARENGLASLLVELAESHSSSSRGRLEARDLLALLRSDC